MKQSKNILFTFDYELFLGTTSGIVQKCLIEPTHLILKILEKYNIQHAVFFVDTTYLLRLKRENNESCKKDYSLIVNQINKMVNSGHYVFPHIHPHWLDAVYNSEINQWHLNDYSKYRFHNVAAQEREEVFKESIYLLKSIISSPNYSPNGYRAGGWSIQPFIDFKDLFLEFNIKYEFSVVKGFKNISKAQYFDFSLCPQKSIYNFEDDPCVEKENGTFTEYTISSLIINTRLYWLSKVWNKYLWKTNQRSMGDGAGIVIKDKSSVKNKTDLLGAENREMVAIELLTKVKLTYYKKFLKKNDYMHFISHPKMFSNHNLKIVEAFLKFACKEYTLQTDFVTFKE